MTVVIFRSMMIEMVDLVPFQDSKLHCAYSFPLEHSENSLKFRADGNATAKSLASVEKNPSML